MTKFAFPLKTVERVREVARDERRGQLADALRVDGELARQQQELTGELDALRERQRTPLGAVDVDKLLEQQRYELLLRAQMSNLIEQRMHVNKEIEQRRQMLVEADREVKVVAKLRSQQFERWRLEQARAEQRMLDEVATLKHYRGDVD